MYLKNLIRDFQRNDESESVKTRFFVDAWLFLGYVLLIAFFALRDSHLTKYNGVSISAKPSVAIEVWGGSDAGSYLRAGYSLATEGSIAPDLRWTKIFWPPGNTVLNAISIKVMGAEGQFILFLVLVHVIIWAAALFLVTLVLRQVIHWSAAIVIVLLTVGFDLFKDFLLGTAIVYSDSITAALLTISLSSTLLSLRNTMPMVWITMSGTSLAAAAHFRGQYFFAIQGIFVLALITGFLFLGSAILKRTGRSKISHQVSKFVDLRLFVLGVVAFTLCIPNLVARERQLGDIPWDTVGRYHWTSTEAFAVAGNWMYEEDLAGFVAAGGQGTACKVDPIKCLEINTIEKNSEQPFSIYDDEPYSATEFQKMVRKTFVSHPLKWAEIKTPYFLKFWYSEPSVASAVGSQKIMGTWTLLGLLAAILIATYTLLLSHQRRVGAILFFAIVFATLLPPYMAHYETRYLVFTKIIGFLTSAMVIAYASRLVVNYISFRYRNRIWTTTQGG